MYFNKRIISLIISIAVIVILYPFFRKHTMIHALADIKNSHDAINLFPTSVKQIKEQTKQSLEQAQQELDIILAIANDERTYANTVAALDHLIAYSNAVINSGALSTLDMVHPDEKIRCAARDAVLATQNFFIDHVVLNKDLYNAIKAYTHGNVNNENLSEEQRYFLKKTIEDFEREGLNLPQEKLNEVKKIKKELAELEQQFDKNIAQDHSKILVTKEELPGLDEDFIKSLTITDEGLYSIGVDYPTYLQVMENCTNATTRKNVWQSFDNRAYPINKPLLEEIIAKRYALAQLLNFPTFATLELDDQMVHTPVRASEFLNTINRYARKKAVDEFNQFTQVLPESVQLTSDGNLYQWDVLFIKNQYQKKALQLNQNKIAEYFPMQNTIDSLLKIYQDFFSLEFKQLPLAGAWDSDVKLIEVIDKTSNQTLGYLFLDLFPRANKYSHACESTIVPVTYTQDKPNLGVAIVIANFPKPMADKPSLLHLKDVNTFFHEFGHAMHALLGRTNVIAFSGANVKRDFVEMPSQMLEEWLWDAQILKMVSHHYQTGNSLPQDLINTILASRTYDSGFFVVRQLFLANLSLELFNNGPQVDLDSVIKRLFEQFMVRVKFDPMNHMYASFGHLIGYGSRYYGYMWSKVFAHDLFGEIKKEGLLNPVVGQRYVDTVIGKGGSKDPNELLKDFLGRAPSQEPFLQDMGLIILPAQASAPAA